MKHRNLWADIWIHGKQGDDFGNCLEASSGKLVGALRLWAEHLTQSALAISRLADDIEVNESDIQVEADCHMVAIIGDADKITALANRHQEILYINEDFEDCEALDGEESQE